MPLRRSPLRETQAPGYPTASEFTADRRSFIGLLGLGVLCAGGAAVLSSCRDSRLGGDVRPAEPPPPDGTKAQPAAVPGGAPVPPNPPEPQAVKPGAHPQAQMRGRIRAVEPPPPAQPEARLKGDVAPVKPATIEPDEKPKPQPAAQPAVSPPGGLRPTAQPKPHSPDKPQARPDAKILGGEG